MLTNLVVPVRVNEGFIGLVDCEETASYGLLGVLGGEHILCWMWINR